MKNVEILRDKLLSNGLTNEEFVINHNNGDYNVILECMEVVSKKEHETFEEAVEPLMKWLSENQHPHTMAEVESNRAVLWEGKQTHLTEEFIID